MNASRFGKFYKFLDPLGRFVRESHKIKITDGFLPAAQRTGKFSRLDFRQSANPFKDYFSRRHYLPQNIAAVFFFEESDGAKDVFFRLFTESALSGKRVLDGGLLKLFAVFDAKLFVELEYHFRADALDGSKAFDIYRHLFFKTDMFFDMFSLDIFFDLFGDALADTGDVFKSFQSALFVRVFDALRKRLDGMGGFFVRSGLKSDSFHLKEYRYFV